MTENDTSPLLSVRDLVTWFPVRRGILSRTVRHIRAVDNVSFDVKAGETLGLVGESGCGKTTLGRSLLGLEVPRSGRILYRGIDITHLKGKERKPYRKRLQIIFQDPLSSLNPRLNVLDILCEGPLAFGMSKDEAEANALRRLQDVGMGADALYRYPHEFSGGQRQRISIARAISVQPEFIVCDEAVSALDVSVQAQVINLLMDLQERFRLSYLFISHDISVVRHIADRVAVMYLGKIVELGPTESVIHSPRHPYTRSLISAVPVPGGKADRSGAIGGETPSVTSLPTGCRFHPRCPDTTPDCEESDPGPRGDGSHDVWCHYSR